MVAHIRIHYAAAMKGAYISTLDFLLSCGQRGCAVKIRPAAYTFRYAFATDGYRSDLRYADDCAIHSGFFLSHNSG